MNQGWTTIGKVRTVQAPRRELRLDMMAPYRWPEGHAPGWIHLSLGAQPPRRYKVVQVEPDDAAPMVVLAAGVPRETVAALRGADFVVPEAEAPEWRSEGWYAREWLHYSVVDARGNALGTVREVWHGPTSAITVESESGDAWTLPVIEEVILNEDRDKRVLTISSLEEHGLKQ
jgi:ribosomal 30S subunit maturation factor RimM